MVNHDTADLLSQFHAARASHDRLEELLTNWSAWMGSGGNPQFHVAAHSAGKGFTHYDTEGAYIKLDVDNAKTVDAIVQNDCGTAERRALYCEYLGATMGRPEPYQVILTLAREEVRAGCVRKGILTV